MNPPTKGENILYAMETARSGVRKKIDLSPIFEAEEALSIDFRPIVPRIWPAGTVLQNTKAHPKKNKAASRDTQDGISRAVAEDPKIFDGKQEIVSLSIACIAELFISSRAFTRSSAN